MLFRALVTATVLLATIKTFLPMFTDTTPAIFNRCQAFIDSSVILCSGTLRRDFSEIGVDGQTEFTNKLKMVTCITESFVNAAS